MKRTLILAVLLTAGVAMAQGSGGGAAGGGTGPGMGGPSGPNVEHPQMGVDHPQMGPSMAQRMSEGEDFSWVPSLTLFSVPMHPGGSQPGFGNPMNPGASQPGQWILPADALPASSSEGDDWDYYQYKLNLDRIQKTDSRRYDNLMKVKQYCTQYATATTESRRKSTIKSMRPYLDHELKSQQEENEIRIKDLEQQLARAKETHRWRAEHWNDTVDQTAREITSNRRKK